MKAVILAAGESSRFKPVSDERHKALTHVMGKPVIQHTVDELEDVVDETIVVQGPEKMIEGEVVADRFVVQEAPRGMGDALLQAREHLGEKFLVLTPYRANASELFEKMIEKSLEEGSDTVLVSSTTETPEKYGIISFKGEKAGKVVEKPSREEAPSDRKVVGMYLLGSSIFEHLDEVEKWEYQFEDALNRRMEEEAVPVIEVQEETNSLKYPWDLFDVTQELLQKSESKISDQAEIEDSAELKGKVIVEEGAEIMENAVVKGPAYIGRNAVVGNNALIRKNSCLEGETVAGANSELKNTVLQPGASIHSGFLGDSIIGRKTNIGAGTVTANRNFEREGISTDLIAKGKEKNTGRDYLGVSTGENVDIGVNCSLMPGVQIGSNACIGPGTVVKNNLKRGETVYVEQQQVRDD